MDKKVLIPKIPNIKKTIINMKKEIKGNKNSFASSKYLENL